MGVSTDRKIRKLGTVASHRTEVLLEELLLVGKGETPQHDVITNACRHELERVSTIEVALVGTDLQHHPCFHLNLRRKVKA